MSDRYPDVEITSGAQWRAWLVEHHATSTGIWLVTYKQPDRRHVTYDAIVDEALCFGWVDSRPRSVDQLRSKRLLTPRKPGSARSKVNQDRTARLQQAGLLVPVGAAAVRAAKRDGSWSKLAAVESLIEPDDLCLALDALTDARANWDAFPPLDETGDPRKGSPMPRSRRPEPGASRTRPPKPRGTFAPTNGARSKAPGNPAQRAVEAPQRVAQLVVQRRPTPPDQHLVPAP